MIFTDYYLCIYDIHKPKTLRKMVKRLEAVNSMRIQKSVFEIQCDRNEILDLIHDVNKLIDTDVDRVAIIPLCSDDYGKTEFYGILSRQPVKIPSFYIL